MVIIDGYRIDAAVNEDHSFDSEVTEHPVEEGADVSDHIRARPTTISIQGIVSDTPIGEVATLRGGDMLPSDEAYQRLLDIRAAREPVTITTSLGVFENMALMSLAVPTSAETGDALRFRATFKQIELVTNERTTVKVAVPRAKKKVTRGNKVSPAVFSKAAEEASIAAIAAGVEGAAAVSAVPGDATATSPNAKVEANRSSLAKIGNWITGL